MLKRYVMKLGKCKRAWPWFGILLLAGWWPASTLAQPELVATNFTLTLAVGAQQEHELFSNVNACATDKAIEAVKAMLYTVVDRPVHGALKQLDPPLYSWCCVYSATNRNYTGPDAFTWRVSDGSRTSNVATCFITILSNQVPVAVSATNSLRSGAAQRFQLVYEHPDSDAGQAMTIGIVGAVSNGSTVLSYETTNVFLSYCPAPGFTGTDTCIWTVSDGISTSATAEVTFTVTSGAPVPASATVIAAPNTSLPIPLSWLGGGGYVCWPVLQTPPAHGTLTTNGNSFGYTPSSNYVGRDSFNWCVAYSNSHQTLTRSAGVACSIVVNESTDWTQWRFDECRTAQSPVVLPASLHLQWKRELPSCPGTFDCIYDNDIDNCRPVQLGKQLFVSLMANDSISAYHTDTGVQQWRYYTSGALRRPPLALRLAGGINVVIFGCDDGTVYCLNAADGSERWKFRAAPTARKAMGFGRLSSLWPVWASPVASNGRVYFVAGYIPSRGLFAYCLDAASGTVIWKNDGQMLEKGQNSTLGPLAFSTDHSRIFGTTEGKNTAWVLNSENGCLIGHTGRGSGHEDLPGAQVFWFIDGSGVNAIREPLSITAGAQTYTPDTAMALGVTGRVDNLMAGDGKLFVTATASSNRLILYCYGGAKVPATIYSLTNKPLPVTHDVWASVVQRMLSREDLKQGLALVWGVGSGRLVEELATQGTNLMIVAVDPDGNKLQRLRRKMDAAGLSGTRVSTLQGDPRACGFAPYQAALIASEDMGVAGFPAAGPGATMDGMAWVRMLYTCTRPFGGEIWLPTSQRQHTAMAGWLSAVTNRVQQGTSPSYDVQQQTGFTGLGVAGFTQIRRLGLPDESRVLKPPFRLTTFGVSGAEIVQLNIDHDPSTYTLDPRQPYSLQNYWITWGVGSNLFKGVKSGRDLYSWLPITAPEPGYEPAPPKFFNTKTGGTVPFEGVIRNPLYAWPEARPEIFSWSPRFPLGSCSGCNRYGNIVMNPGKGAWLADGADYWGVLPIMEMGGCGAACFSGNGMAVFASMGVCNGCNKTMALTQIGLVPVEDTEEENWVFYRASRSMRRIQENPIRSVGINFGAPGDRLDPDTQRLWTHHPLFAREGEAPPLIPVSYRGGVTNRYHWSGAMAPVNNRAPGWVPASYVAGMTGLSIPLAQPLVATRGTPTLPLNGAVNEGDWGRCNPIDLATGCGIHARRCYVQLAYDATNLYVAGVLHQSGPRPSADGGTCPVYMKVALGARDHLLPPAQTLQLCYGEGGQKSFGLSTQAWTAAYATNREMFTGEICVPWASLAAAGLWSSQLVMNVEVCGNFLNGQEHWSRDSTNLFARNGSAPFSEVANCLSPLYFDAARGPVAEVTPHTVRLYFAEMEGLTQGQRVFDVQLQGQTVLTNLDVFAAAGGPCREIIREFPNIGVADKLDVDFIAHAGAPMLGGVEIVATGTAAVHRLPVALIDASTVSGAAPLRVNFSAQRSFAPDGQIVECAWDTGDGRVARGSCLPHVFAEPGTYHVCLLVLDSHGATAATRITVNVAPGVPAAFVCNIRARPGSGCDYTSLSAWSHAMDGASGGCDLMSATTLFQVSTQGVVSAGQAMTFTGGQTGVLRQITSWGFVGYTNVYAEVASVGGTGTLAIGQVTFNDGAGSCNGFAIMDTGVATTSLLFTVASTPTYDAATDDGQVVLFPGGGSGRLTHINQTAPRLALITECHGVILPGPVTCCASGHSFTISDAGHPVETVVADCYHDWTNGLRDSVTLGGGGWIMDPTHCVIIRAAAGSEHTGRLKTAKGVYTGFALQGTLNASGLRYARIQQMIVDGGRITMGAGSSVNRVLGSVTANGKDVTIANSLGPVFSVGNNQDISLYNCTGGAFELSDLTRNRVRAVNCLAYAHTNGFTVDPAQEIWLSHCISVDGSATGSDGWLDGNEGNLANQRVTFVCPENGDYQLADTDAGAQGRGTAGLGADINGRMRRGPRCNVGASESCADGR